MRIKTGTIEAEVLKVVDKDVFEFYPQCDPISIEIMSDVIATVKFEIRILNKVIEQLPNFDQGDLTIRFDDGSSVQVYRHLLSLHSSYMRKCMQDSMITCVEDFAREPFIEMLYQMYPTLRPIYRNIRGLAKAAVAFQVNPLVYKLSKHLVNFNTRAMYPTLRPIYRNIRGLAKAAVAFQVNPLIYKLSKHLVNFNTRAMSLEQKLRAALDLELCPAVEELVYRAAQDGVWSHLIKLGFEPEIFFGPEVYKKVVCPAIIAVRPIKSEKYQQTHYTCI
ncbi:unnamed protein product [Strongylus vulgaris]|uniref:BTB domain-containing protein n=1 Tax=Strongylus vulgaris TaxID=40348 RepID=A0A3P7LUB6_STRVU|nr:unnamed protein product [Strongylus vulgaris]